MGQGYIFTGVCHSVHRGGGVRVVSQHALQQVSRGVWSGPRLPAPGRGGLVLRGSVPARGVCSQGGLQAHTQGGWGGIRSRLTPKGEIEGVSDLGPHPRGNWGGSGPGPHLRGKLRGIRSRPTPKAEIEGVSNLGPHPKENWGGSGPDPHLREELRGIRSRPTPKGEIEGDRVQVHTQGGNWGGSGPGPHPRGKLRGIWSSPPRMATAAGGTHPTGMHSCIQHYFEKGGPTNGLVWKGNRSTIHWFSLTFILFSCARYSSKCFAEQTNSCLPTWRKMNIVFKWTF